MYDILIPLFDSNETFLARSFYTCFNLSQVLFVDELKLNVRLHVVDKLSYPVAIAELLHLVYRLLHFLYVLLTGWIHLLEQL